jgi:hypothetical protein
MIGYKLVPEPPIPGHTVQSDDGVNWTETEIVTQRFCRYIFDESTNVTYGFSLLMLGVITAVSVEQ